MVGTRARRLPPGFTETDGGAAAARPALDQVDVASGSAQADNRSFDADLSADGRFVSFVSEATNLVPHDTNGTTDVFARGPLSDS